MPPTGLRERKRAKVRRDIQANAIALFRRQGYEATTVQQIAEAAVISESTFYRYFPTKADVVLRDDYDPLIAEAIVAQPPELGPMQAIRAGFASVFGTLSAEEEAEQRERLALTMSVPELRAAMLDQFTGGMQLLAEAVGRRTGRPADDPAIIAIAGAVVGALIAAMFAFVGDPDADVRVVIDETLARLEAGLTL
jgi:AcrR family transcriptional regulator